MGTAAAVSFVLVPRPREHASVRAWYFVNNLLLLIGPVERHLIFKLYEVRKFGRSRAEDQHWQAPTKSAFPIFPDLKREPRTLHISSHLRYTYIPIQQVVV
jgi:hypothetical protein